MVAATEKGPNKTAFVMGFLEKDSKAGHSAVNEAWAKAGNPGTVSESLVHKLRARAGLTGNTPGRSGANGSGAAKPKAAKKKPGPKPKGQGVALANGHEPASATTSKPGTGGRARALAEVEADLDRLIYKLISLGGMAQVEEALRAARRVVVRSHGG